MTYIVSENIVMSGQSTRIIRLLGFETLTELNFNLSNPNAIALARRGGTPDYPHTLVCKQRYSLSWGRDIMEGLTTFVACRLSMNKSAP